MGLNIKRFLGYLSLVIVILVAASVLYLQKSFPQYFFFVPENLQSGFAKVVVSILVLSALKLFIGISTKVVTREMEKRNVQDQEIFFMNSLFKILFWVLAVFAILSIFFENVGSFITALGLIGAGLAIAMQHPILNFISWMIILFNKPFLVGDRIEVENSNMDIKGDIIDITPMYTKIRKITKGDEKTGKLINVPNEILILNGVTKSARSTGFLWDRISFNLNYESNLKKAKEIISETAEKILLKYTKFETKEKRKYTDEKVPDKPEVLVELKENAIILTVSYLIQAREKLEARTEINEEIYNALKKHQDIKFKEEN